jgi:hypothetical protein
MDQNLISIHPAFQLQNQTHLMGQAGVNQLVNRVPAPPVGPCGRWIRLGLNPATLQASTCNASKQIF